MDSTQPEPSAYSDDYYCLNCGEKLISQRCKIICPRCGYREDCADAGLIDYDRIERRQHQRESERQSTDKSTTDKPNE